ncbi:MAG: nucleotidyl transferase AbiEii/AbiGii toxin family protein [Cyclobacteriaceae bacterium]
MQDNCYSEKLYPLQDIVLLEVGKLPVDHYLTGGTALSRFMLGHRYSEDLDFFTNQHQEFKAQTEMILQALNRCGNVRINFRAEDFIRAQFERDGTTLKLEFINDVSFRKGKPIRHSMGFWIDDWENILSNKISALTRQAAKDVVDICFIALNYSFHWEQAISDARQKDAWVAEHEVANVLLNFNLDKLNEVVFTDKGADTKITRPLIQQLARDAFNGFDNSLYTKHG